MKRLQKKILGEMLLTVEGAIKQAKDAIRENDINKFQSLLSACQESAIAIGTEIEGLAGEGTQTVGVLEKFCEEIYNVSVRADAGELDQDMTKELSALIEEACGKLEEELAVKSTVLFLPCAAKWWDGFETVWRREKGSPDTEVYVVPIPWYETNLKTNEFITHYDLDEYPSEIGAQDYSSFDVASLHPDVIYIQDASDGQDFARRLDKRFYTGALKLYTDDLVYIPYNIEIEPDLSQQDQLDKLAKSVLVSGLNNVDTIIVQSENMRDAYLKILMGDEEESDASVGRDWASIIKGTGSPRAERIASLKKEDIEIPEAWQSFMLKEDGSRKKIMLYGNSVFTFLRSGSSLIDKIRDSFRVFRENADSIALIWRPHPEIREIIAMLRPELAEDYDRLVEEFLDERIGILDEDEDFTRSIVLSDAFYGDDSVLIYIYQATGKPIMIEDVDIRSNG